ncbi:MAG: hypothetical protein HY931_00770 [Candidatus Falkowbacteria bacterium]|nr:MAG: hypothetical protein HY931_00770 [Candidatus Falkowbacteria bacterium]
MQTNEFLTSIIFPNGAQFGQPVYYSEATKSELPCNLLAHSSGGNLAFFKNCHLTAYLSKNNELISAADVEKGKHIVTDDQKKYILDVYLEVNGDVMSNHISLASPLPKGTEMQYMEAVSEVDIFVFSGFSVILFDIKKESF